MTAHYRALVFGASGLVGTALLEKLAADRRYQNITCILRRPLESLPQQGAPECIQQVVMPLDQLDDCQDLFADSHVYVCLGTTIRQAGSQAAFRQVDFDYVLHAARLAAHNRARSFVWMSSVGANATSSSFYLRVKGELEDAIAAIAGLQADKVRPSLLMGPRREFRLAESAGIWLARLVSPLMLGRLAQYKPVHADDVAEQMIALQRF